VALPPYLTFIERGVLHSNSVVLHAPDRFALFDTGYCTGAAALAQAIVDQAGRPVGELAMIVNTHAHPDHTGGNAYLHERSGCAIVMSDIDRMIVESGDPVTLMREWSDLQCPAFEVTRTVHPGDTLAFGGVELVVVEGSGHSAGEVSYYGPADRVLVCGDVLWQSGFSNVVPLVEGVGGLARHRRSLRALRRLDVELAIPGHGPLIVGADAFRDRIDHTIATLEFYAAHREAWAAANLKGFLVMHVLVAGRAELRGFIARCARAPWFHEQATRFFSGTDHLIDRLLDELLGKRVLNLEADHLTCNLRA
jgi:glyoxylase-like metal-dependent hydrolase (beta-lactamase superfamily II)